MFDIIKILPGRSDETEGHDYWKRKSWEELSDCEDLAWDDYDDEDEEEYEEDDLFPDDWFDDD